MIILCSWLAEVHFNNLQFLEDKIGENFAIYIYMSICVTSTKLNCIFPNHITWVFLIYQSAKTEQHARTDHCPWAVIA